MKKNIFFTVFILFILLTIISNPPIYINTTLDAIKIWGTILLPSLLPFFIFTKLLDSLGTVEHISSVFRPITNIYKTPQISAYVFFMSILTGYPVGSKLIADLYQKGSISKNEAKRCLSFCSNSGPMFIIGCVGSTMLLCKNMGYIIFLSHILGSLLNGLLYRNIHEIQSNPFANKITIKQKQTNLSESVMDSIFSIMLVVGMIVLAFIIIEVLNNFHILSLFGDLLSFLGVKSDISSSIISGFFEVTKGCLTVSKATTSLDIKTIICSFLISFGGLSTLLQSMAFIKPICSYKFAFLQKITHAIFSCVICSILVYIF